MPSSTTRHNNEFHVVRQFLSERFPLQENKSIYSPFELGTFLSRHQETIVDGIRLSNLKIIRYLISRNLIPVQKTTAYKLSTYVAQGLIPMNCSWTDLSRHGKKALLTSVEVMWLVEEIKRESQGGFAMSSSQIKIRLKNYIHKVWSKKGKIHLLSAHISPMTINSFVSMIKSQCVFNLYDTVSNKTES